MNPCTMTRALAILIGCATTISADDVKVTSPDGKVHCELAVEGGRLLYKVAFKGSPVIETSRLGMILDDGDLSQGGELGRTETYQINEKYPWRGIHSEAVNHCHGAKALVTRVTGK